MRSSLLWDIDNSGSPPQGESAPPQDGDDGVALYDANTLLYYVTAPSISQSVASQS